MEEGKAAVHERVLILVSYLSGQKPYSFFRFVEWLGITAAKTILKNKYGAIIVLNGTKATYAALQGAVNKTASNNSVKAIDMILNLHGGYTYLLFAPLLSVPYKEISFSEKAHPKLRLLYSTACYSAEGNEQWLKKGFKAVIGAKGININALTEYPKLLAAWAKGHSVETCYTKAKGIISNATDLVGKIFSKKVNSRKLVTGDGSITIASGNT